jgi:hypothetical protein
MTRKLTQYNNNDRENLIMGLDVDSCDDPFQIFFTLPNKTKITVDLDKGIEESALLAVWCMTEELPEVFGIYSEAIKINNMLYIEAECLEDN